MRRIAICLIVMALSISSYAIGKKYDSSAYQAIPVSINTKGYEFGISFYRENTVVFFRTDSTDKELKDNKLPKITILKSKINSDGELSEPQPCPELEQLGVSGSFAYDKNRDKIYFSKYNEKKKVYQLFESSYKDNQWEDAKLIEIKELTPSRMNMSQIVNANWDYIDAGASIIQPALANNGNRIYFSSNLKGGQGKTDIWYIDYDGTSWSAPVNVGKNINTAGNEQYPFVVGDSLLYYSSDFSGEGKYDLFVARIDNQSIAPENLGQFFNTNKDEYNLISDNKNVFFISARDADKKDDIMRIKKLPVPDPIVFAQSQPEPEPVVLLEPDFHRVLLLFDFDKYVLSSQFEAQLQQVVVDIKQFKDRRFEICGYTDEKGSDQYNDKLSLRRAKTVKEMLIARGISKDILEIKAYGKRKPVVKDAKTDEDNAKNRRVEINFYSQEQTNEK